MQTAGQAWLFGEWPQMATGHDAVMCKARQANPMMQMQVTKVCQPLDDLRDLAGSDSVDTFVLSYTSLLQVHCTPAALWDLTACMTSPSLHFR